MTFTVSATPHEYASLNRTLRSARVILLLRGGPGIANDRVKTIGVRSKFKSLREKKEREIFSEVSSRDSRYYLYMCRACVSPRCASETRQRTKERPKPRLISRSILRKRYSRGRHLSVALITRRTEINSSPRIDTRLSVPHSAFCLITLKTMHSVEAARI